MTKPHGIRNVAVIGAGTMGAQIAAHLANVGIPSLLLDRIPEALLWDERERGLTLRSPEVRNRITETLFERARRMVPSPLVTAEAAKLIRLGNVEDNLGEIREADWIVEAVPERMDVKFAMHTRIAACARPDAFVTTNTSGLSISRMTKGFPLEHRRRFFGTHFFNPPRYVPLLELIPIPDTDPGLLESFAEFSRTRLGRGVVVARDTAGFVANRVGMFAMQQVIRLMIDEGFTIDEVDALTGTAMGRPKSATFRLGDMVGIDILAQMGRNLNHSLAYDPQAAVFQPASFIEEMVERGWLGRKSGQGFYRRVKAEKGLERQTLDYRTMKYGPQQNRPFPSLAAAEKIASPAERLRMLCSAEDGAGVFAWKHISAVLCYAADRLREIADEIVTVDNAMKWGYHWELGPFETWDALGVQATAERLMKEQRAVPAPVRDLLAAGKTAFYQGPVGHTLDDDRGVATAGAEHGVSA
jgi:3-hydroxyacyl-CoA dehydrogenase